MCSNLSIMWNEQWKIQLACYYHVLAINNFETKREQAVMKYVRFQVLTAASMMFRIVFWDVLPCKIIVDLRFRGAYCLHHPWHPRRQFWTSNEIWCSELSSGIYCRVKLLSTDVSEVRTACIIPDMPEDNSEQLMKYDVQSCLLGCTAV
jgi:hypothetical protein